MVMGSFWFGGSFKLTESIQRQEFAVLSILSSTLVIGVGGWTGGALLGESDASVPLFLALVLSLFCIFSSARLAAKCKSAKSRVLWAAVPIHLLASVLSVLLLVRRL
jgi:predicted membrane protein